MASLNDHALTDQPAVLRPSTEEEDMQIIQPYVLSGFRGIIASPYVAGAAILSTIGGLLFGM